MSLFIAFEGPDCCGKTEQIGLLAERILRTTSRPVLRLEFPSKGLGGFAARQVLQANLPWSSVCTNNLIPALIRQCAILADRYANVPEIQNTLCHDGVVVVSRWKPSGMIYGEIDGIGSDWISASQSSLPDADLHFLLDIEPDEVIRRCEARMRKAEVYENLAFQRSVVDRYRKLFAINRQAVGGQFEWFVIDGSQSVAKVHEDVFNVVHAETIRRGF